MQPGELAARMTIPALALVFVVLYNTFYQLTYKRLGNIAALNHLQLAFDALVVTVIVYYSGAVNSWFWSMYSLFILEAAFILPKRRDAWLLTALCIGLLGALELVDLMGLIVHIDMPFQAGAPGDIPLHLDPVFVAVRFGWQVAVLCGTAAVSTQLVGAQRAESSTRQQLVVLDEATGLYSRAYFLRAFSAEVTRARRDNRQLHVLLIDVDRFGDFNRRFGIETGDLLLNHLASAITQTVGEAGDMLVTTNIAARFGGEEFVVLLAEDGQVHGSPQHDDAVALGERLRKEIAATRIEGAGVTVSVGVASFPEDGASADELLDAADAALAIAVGRGGDVVSGIERDRHTDGSAADGASSHDADDLDDVIEPLGNSYRDSLEE
jgi:diguanylate cyclase (GGDEF)-like protein